MGRNKDEDDKQPMTLDDERHAAMSDAELLAELREGIRAAEEAAQQDPER